MSEYPSIRLSRINSTYSVPGRKPLRRRACHIKLACITVFSRPIRRIHSAGSQVGR
jgi:hypothetical protein